jgi:metal-dependent amidase/aminoacylase/carboxypeptidase family protein
VIGTLKDQRHATVQVHCAPKWDALHIEEQNDFPACSAGPRRMHDCGHGGHTAILLGCGQAPDRNAEFRRDYLFHLSARRGE